jgi:hypothetical protein
VGKAAQVRPHIERALRDHVNLDPKLQNALQ